MTIHVIDHPLVHHKLSLIRDRKTPGSLFRALIEEVGLILAIESTRTLPTESVVVETPLERTSTLRLKALDPVLVPVLRAGLGLLPSFLQLLPTAKVGHLGLYRDHDSLVPVPYYRNFAINLTLVSVLAAPEGLERLQGDHPDLTIVVGAVDRQLNEKGYILPGLGDAGDRLFGTA